MTLQLFLREVFFSVDIVLHLIFLDHHTVFNSLLVNEPFLLVMMLKSVIA